MNVIHCVNRKSKTCNFWRADAYMFRGSAPNVMGQLKHFQNLELIAYGKKLKFLVRNRQLSTYQE